MVATIDARQRRGPVSSERRRSGSSSTGSAGGWGGRDAILDALEGPGRCRIRRGCRVTWHSRSLNTRAGGAAPVVERVRAPLVPLAVLRLTRQRASRSCRPLPQLLFLLAQFAGSVNGEGLWTLPTSAHRKCHYRHGPHHLLPLLPPLRQKADAHFDGWIGCCWQDDHSV